MGKLQKLCVLGSTGSIGVSTLDVARRNPEHYSVYALSANKRIEALVQQAKDFAPKVVVVPNDAARKRFLALWPAALTTPEIRQGAQALCDTAADPLVDVVMAAIVGAAGLPSALAAAQAGKKILLANKEALVSAGALFMSAIEASGAQLLPIDSEHNAIFQCLPQLSDANGVSGNNGVSGKSTKSIRRLILTASGGPFRQLPTAQLSQVTPQQACAHPTWNMGKKISVDSATMLNKGLEVIEAHWLFAMPADKIEVVIHPQSLVHSMVEYADGSLLAQLGQPDMRTPIAHAMGYPERIASGVGLFDLACLGSLEFELPDLNRFPCLHLSYEALRAGQGACIILNAANEVAVEKFLAGQIPYTQIAGMIQMCLEALSQHASCQPGSLAEILQLDQQTRHYARALSN